MNCIHQKYRLLLCILALGTACSAQLRVTVPWSNSLNLNFGTGKTNPGPPLRTGSTSFTYTTDPCPPAGSYTVVSSSTCPSLTAPARDAGHFFMGAVKMPGDTGYMMLATIGASTSPQLLFADTVRNLCSNNAYLFWAGIMKTSRQTCFYPNFTLLAETSSGQLIQSFQTGNIGGPGDKPAFYPGYYDPLLPPPPFPYYGGIVNLPAGVTELVLKIIANPSAADSHCTSNFAIDNIFFTPAGPDINISAAANPFGWITGACFDGTSPIAMNAAISDGYLNFGGVDYIKAAIANVQLQWQQSADGGFTWADIAGSTGTPLSYQPRRPGVLYIRVRASDAADIANLNCSVLSNVVRVQVDSFPPEAKLSANSPVCTDADLVFKMEGGASYLITGPGGYADNSAFPHINNPPLSATGWYHAQIVSFGGCRSKDSVYVQVTGPPVHVSADTAVCYGQAVTLKASGGILYTWSPVAGLSHPQLANPRALPLKTTRYTVKITDQNGCSDRAAVTVTVKDSLLKAGIAGTTVVCPGDIAIFKDSSIGKIAGWRWDFGNGQTSLLQNPPPQVFPPAAANSNYQVTLVVTDTAGCSGTASQTVQSPASCLIAVANAFTPNGDGLNDYLYPLNAWKAAQLEFLVYNRYGQLVFKQQHPADRWNGAVNGALQEAGIYVWVLRYIDRDTGNKVSRKGTAVLIR